MKRSEKNEETKAMKAAAFTAWQVTKSIHNLLETRDKTEFMDYLKAFNIMTEADKEAWMLQKIFRRAQDIANAKEAEERAQKAIEADKKGQSKVLKEWSLEGIQASIK